MNIIKNLKKILSDACVYFTAAEFFLLIVATGLGEISPDSGGGVSMFLSLGSAALIFVACLMMSALNLTFRLDLSFMLQMLIHFVGSLLTFGVVFIIIPGAWSDFSSIFVRLGVFSLLYFVIAFAVIIHRSVRNNRRAEKLEYESQFGEFFNGKHNKGKK